MGEDGGPLGAIEVVNQSNQQQTNWAPRIGLAWTFGGGKWVVRSGHGIAYDFNFLNPITNLRFAAPFMYSFTTNDFTGANSFANMAAGTNLPAQISAPIDAEDALLTALYHDRSPAVVAIRILGTPNNSDSIQLPRPIQNKHPCPASPTSSALPPRDPVF